MAAHLVLAALALMLLKVGPRVLDRDAAPAETVVYFDLAFPEEDAGAGPQTGETTRPAAPGAADGTPTEQAAPRDGAQPPGEELQFPTGEPAGIPPPGAAPAEPGAGSGGSGTGGEPGGSGTGGNPLRPGVRDPRLFPTRRPVPAELERTEHERYMDRLGTTLGAINDSVAAEAEREGRALDWTLKDKDGNRWGVSPGKIHLGKVTIPAPVGFAASPEAAAEARREASQRGEIDRQVADRERRDSFRERVNATRERKDDERRRIRGES